MNVAIPVWNGRVSPVFDTAATVVVVEFDDKREVARYRIVLGEGSPSERVKALKTGGVDVLLCGAVSRPLLDMLLDANIETTPFLAGNVDDLLHAYLGDRLSDPGFLMPGCCHRRRRHMRRRSGGRMRYGKEKT